MSNPLLTEIESKLDLLIERCLMLENENAQLKANQESWSKERSRLIEKNEMARSRVEAMIAHLKSLETES